MAQFKINNRHVIPAFNEASKLQQWLRPGLLAYVVGTHVDALKGPAERLSAERTALVAQHAKHYPELGDDQQPHPLAGKLMETLHANGETSYELKSPEDGVEFRRREAELMDATTTVTVDERLTIEHIRKLDAERLPTPRAGADPVSVDFSAIVPLINAPAFDAAAT